MPARGPALILLRFLLLSAIFLTLISLCCTEASLFVLGNLVSDSVDPGSAATKILLLQSENAASTLISCLDDIDDAQTLAFAVGCFQNGGRRCRFPSSVGDAVCRCLPCSATNDHHFFRYAACPGCSAVARTSAVGSVKKRDRERQFYQHRRLSIFDVGPCLQRTGKEGGIIMDLCSKFEEPFD